MARYCGNIGFRTTVETEPGIWSEEIVPRGPYYGDVQKNYTRSVFSEYTTTIKTPICNNCITIVADAYANENFQNIVYAEYKGGKWLVSNIEDQRPRLILTLGGVYNGEY